MLFTETLLGELGSSSGSMKNGVRAEDPDEDDEEVKTFLSADSGASEPEQAWAAPREPHPAEEVKAGPEEPNDSSATGDSP